MSHRGADHAFRSAEVDPGGSGTEIERELRVCATCAQKPSASAVRAAWKPHIPWTPPPGDVDAEQR